MDPRSNPYAPGAGLQPPELTGRDDLIEAGAIALDRLTLKRPTKGIMLLGLRGVGKTVLLNRFIQLAEERDFQIIKVEAPEGGMLPKLLAAELRRVLYRLDLKKASGNALRRAMAGFQNFAKAFKLKYGELEFGIEPAPGLADTGDIEQDLPELIVAVAEAAAERGAVVGIFIDEVQYLSREELAALIVACHYVSQKNLPLIFVGAGLPQIAALAGNAKSYAERLFVYPQVDKLDLDAARNALALPAQALHVTYSDEAMLEILHMTDRYPYFIQLWGALVWDLATETPISVDTVNRAVPKIFDHLDHHFFRVRFDRLTALQQKYLRAMAELGSGPQKTGDIAAVLGVDPKSVAMTRQQLIAKGMIYSQRHGETAFTVPLFDAFMRRQMPTFEKHTPIKRL